MDDKSHLFEVLFMSLLKAISYLIVASTVFLGFEFTEVGYSAFWESNNPGSTRAVSDYPKLPNGDIIAWIDFDNRSEVTVKIIKNPTLREYCRYRWDGKGAKVEKYKVPMRKGNFINLSGNGRLYFLNSSDVFNGMVTSSSRLITISEKGIFGDVQFQYLEN